MSRSGGSVIDFLFVRACSIARALISLHVMVVNLSDKLRPLPNSAATVVGCRWAGSQFRSWAGFRKMVELDVGWVHVGRPCLRPFRMGVYNRIEVPFSHPDSLVRSFAWSFSSTSILLASLYCPRFSQVTYSFLLATCESFPVIHISYLILLTTFQINILDRPNENCLRKPPSNRVSRPCHLSRERQVENFDVKQGPYQAL
jgi:hypothetical protein